uniref:Uncharacterized protein n=1 Tax=Salix viminalis TaxID=40686 RepID=A0A6N2LU22_SALVM
MALYKGFIPTISRQGPFTVVLFVTLEQSLLLVLPLLTVPPSLPPYLCNISVFLRFPFCQLL